MEHFWNKMEQQKPRFLSFIFYFGGKKMELRFLLFFIVLFSLILLFSVEFVNGQEIDVNYPDEVSVGEEFDVRVELANFSEDVYDVKIDIFCSGERISRIFDKKWKSTNYYVNNIIDFPSKNKENFSLNITKECEEADLSVSIRNSKDSVKKFSGYTVKAVINEEDVKNEEAQKNETAKVGKEVKETKEQVADAEKNNTEGKVENETNQTITSSVIKLNTNTQDSKVYKSRSEYIKQYAVYGFAVFLSIILIALIIHGRRKN